MGLRALAVAAVVVLTAMLSQAAGAGETSFRIDPFSGVALPGDSFVVSGRGCAPTGAFPIDDALHLRLTPPTGGNDWQPALIAGSLGVISSSQLVAGEVDVQVTPNADGTFQVTIPIPSDAPVGEYTARGICLSVVEPGDRDDGFSQASYDAGFADAAGINVQAASSPSEQAPTSTAALVTAPAVVPSFTG